MSLRWKIALALAGLTFVASAVVGAAVYRVTKDRLLNEIDRSLAEVSQRPGRGQFDLDSMDILNLAVAIHDRTGIDIPEADYPKLATLAGAIAYLSERTEGA